MNLTSTGPPDGAEASNVIVAPPPSFIGYIDVSLLANPAQSLTSPPVG